MSAKHFTVLISFIAFLSSPNSSLACSYAPGYGPDLFSEETTALGFARIDKISRTKFGENGSCLSVRYSATKSLIGNFPTLFEVANCDEDYPLDRLKSEADDDGPMSNFFGVKVQNNVLVGLVLGENSPADIRYFEYNCWGPLHYNKDFLSQVQQDEVLGNLSFTKNQKKKNDQELKVTVPQLQKNITTQIQVE